jgi:glycosyltransferase involved in cell wall biosynthesis
VVEPERGLAPDRETAARGTIAPAAARRGPDAAARSLRLAVLIPCLDEEATVAQVIAAIPAEVAGVAEVVAVVIDDGSTDATAERAQAAGARVVAHGANLGLGKAFRTGVHEALRLGADLVVNIDGDGQFDPAEIPRLLGPILDGRAHMVTASRFMDPELVPRMPRIKRWGNRWVARIVQLLSGRRFHDVSCGFRAFSREALLHMNLFGGLTYTQETFLDLVFKELAVVEVPVRVRGTREFGRSRVASNLPRYAVRSLQIMLRAFIAYRPFSFFATLAAGFFGLGAGLLGFLLGHYLRAGSFSPHIWAGFVGGALALVGLITLLIGIVGDMMVRIRMNQEKILYFLKRDAYARPPAS